MPTGSEREPWASTQPHPTSHASSGRPPPPAIWLPASNSSSPSTHQPANSQPGRISSDHPVPLRAPLPISISTSTTTTKPTHSLVLAKPSPRSTSLPFAAAAMGQSFAKAPHASSSTTTTGTPPAPPSSPSTAARGLNAAISGGFKLKRAFAARRKKNDSEGKIERSKSRDALLLQPHSQDHFRQGIQATPSSASSPAQVMSDSVMAHHRGAKPFSQLATQVFNKRSPKATPPAPQPQSQSQSQLQGPPPLPPKAEAQLKAQLRPQHSQGAAVADHHRSSIIPLSPGISSAVSFMRSIGEQDREREKADERERERVQAREREREKEKEKERQAVLEKEKEKEKEHLKEQEAARQRQKEAEKTAADAASKADMKDTWRKSDSTIGHHTIRPGATAGPRPSRPVSMAESLQSNHTIVPVNKRLSALVTDVNFGMPEEESERVAKGTAPEDNTTTTPTIVSTPPPPPPQVQAVTRAPPTPPPNAQKRRSMSVNITSHAPFLHAKLPPAPASASVTELKYPSHSISEGMMPPSMSPTLSRETPSLSRTPANATGFIGPSSHGGQSTGHNIRGKLAAWTNASNSPAPSSSGHSSHGHGHSNTQTNIMNPYTTFPPPPEAYRSERRLPALPPQQQQQQPTPSFRQTAISMTNSLAPAAGLAKRAVEKMGRAWGGLSSGSSSAASAHTGTGTSATSGYSSSGSTGTGTGTAPSSYAHSYSQSQDIGHELARTVSSQSSTGGSAVHHHIERDKKGRLRHIPKAPSGSSIVSGNAASLQRVPDAFGPPSGPVLGKRLRGPLRVKHGGGGGSGGVVFGRDLKAVVRETGVWVGKPKAWGGRWRNWDGEGGGDAESGEEAWRARRASVRRGQLKALEERRLPALVVRCAQHLLIWGVQEEGLFRVSGRPAHVTKLRSEFDTGADFDMTECEPGDLDPHAVASVFKAFLRELPEPILTHALLPFFEAAMSQESANNAAEPSSAISPIHSRGPGLPSNPRNSGLPPPGMRKPPSLSTLAMPSLTGMRPPSKSLLNIFQSLIAQLPEENRDLIRTVTELIKATARESKETKMPLSNLLLVFCPSLNMNPPLLKLLCEGEGIWEAPVLDIKNEESPAVDTSSKNVDDVEEDEFSDARDGMEDDGDGEMESILSESVGRTSEDIPSSVEYHASVEDVLERVKTETRRDPVSTVYLDTESTFPDDTSSMSQPAQRSHTRNGSVATSSFRDDGSSYTSEDQENPARHYSDAHSHSQSPPLLTSSAESLDTPSMSSGHPSFSHLHLHPADNDVYEKKSPIPTSHQGTSGPMIAEPSPMGLSPATPRKPVISNPIPITGPVHFPSTTSDTTHMPASPSASEKRRSIPILSLPNFSPTKLSSGMSDGGDSPRTPDSARAKRLKKPSLHLLFAKKSASSLSIGNRAASSPSRPVISAPYLQSPRSASDSSISTPRSAVTAPQSSTNTLPPTLNTPIESGSLGIGLGLGIDITETSTSPPKLSSRPSKESARPLPVPPAQHHQYSASCTSLGVGPTPIANAYRRSPSPGPSLASKSTVSLVSPDAQAAPAATHLRPHPARSRGLSTSSQASSNHLGMLDDEEPTEDWTRSVLLAADVSLVASSH